MRLRLPTLVLLAALLGACAGGDDGPPIVVVGFFADPSVTTPGRVMVSRNRRTFAEPQPLGENGEWLTEVAAHGDRFTAIGIEGGVYDSDETGTRWTRRQIHQAWLDAVHFPAGAPGVGFLSGADALWTTQDGGQSWLPARPPGFYFEDLAFESADGGVAVEGYLIPPLGKVWRTDDGGRGWAKVAEIPRGLRGVAGPDDGSGELWAVGDEGAVLASQDGGATWTDLSGPGRLEAVPDFTDVDFAGPDAGWMVGTRGAARAYRGRALPPERRWTHGIAGDFVLQGVHAVSRDEAWACGYRSGTDRGVVLHTIDGGRTWDRVVETPGIFWYSIAGYP